ncbi:polysaccharide biosynthesis C-terminal domain-containing protein [Aquimarina brevivitae]|uniref:O-antigen/teichoic acid export membrane protein n=1 Tax=Aquimarina brevivitae TaxID=323412 RepID=A0A4Q7P4J5_9FLAO|nr:polysaccharide biosynthesis C-terminal domain-containing protein [Aquimarina brevivitae]RZS93612.1 O-antigen/teichoic acid export membrane protein [Aquimarina brevivitae]
MGIVIKQSIRNVVITCIGFAIGAINTLFLFTHFLSKEYYGLVTYLFSASNLIWPLVAFGVHNTLVKFFSSYTSPTERNKFLTLILLLPLVTGLILGIAGNWLYDLVITYFSGQNDIVVPYIWTIYVLAISLAYFEVFFAWSKVKLKSVFGNMLKELFLRLWLFLGLFLVYFSVITVTQFVYSLVVAYIIRMLIMLGYAIRLQKVKLTFSLPSNYSKVLKYSFLILIAGSVATLLIDLDKTMLERYLPIENVAKYGICAYIASVIIIPSRAMHQITYPLTAHHLNSKDFSALSVLYKKSSLNLLITSGLLFVLIVCNVHTLFLLIPPQYELYIEVVVLIALAKLLDNLIGNNNSILFNSDYYRLVLIIGIIMVLVSFGLNLLCIPQFGLVGAAIATFAAVCSYNVLKLWLVWVKFKMQPFSKNTIPSLLCILLLTAVFYFWNFNFHPIISIALKSLVIVLSYLSFVVVFNLSEEIINTLKRFVKRAK